MKRKPIIKKDKGNVVPILPLGKKGSGKIPIEQKQPIGNIRDWEPSEQERTSVRLLISSGKTVEEIARIIHPDGPVSTNTVRRKFKTEIKDGKNIIAKELLDRSFACAMSNMVGHMQMKIFLLKSLFGLRDYGPASGAENKEPDKKAVSDYLQQTATAMANTMPEQPKEDDTEKAINEN